MNIHTITTTIERDRAQAIQQASTQASNIIEVISPLNMSNDMTTISNLNDDHRNKLTKIQQTVLKQPVLVQAELSKKLAVNDYIHSLIITDLQVTTEQLSKDNNILSEENQMIKEVLLKECLTYDTKSIIASKEQNQRELDQLKRDLEFDRKTTKALMQNILKTKYSK